MATENKPTGTTTAGRTTSPADNLQKARAAKGTRPKYDLTPDQREAVQIIGRAKRACAMLRDRIQSGKPINGDAMRSCSNLSAALGEIIADSL